ncbi:MAG: DUF896 domain-containing protein [Ruminococcaceae bacterium]|nr:DUF896 domain-containing protein [Oscillospiraceae bacterium]
MEQAQKDRISELTRISRERELSAEEKEEREMLRALYLADWRKSTTAVLDNTYLVDEEGNKKKLGKKD